MALYALCDANNFFASAERLFRPDLKHTPVLVSSSNDGCTIARCALTKALGFKMGQPLYQVRGLIEQHNVKVFSSNFTLYGDISHRMMATLEMAAPCQPYSIDEAFLILSDMGRLLQTQSDAQRECTVAGPADGRHTRLQHSSGDISLRQPAEAWGRNLLKTVKKHVGIDVCIGIAPTKTLAKLANHGAKCYPATQGVVDLTRRDRQRRLLAITDVGDVWGVGGRSAEKLNNLGITTALQLAEADPHYIRQRFSVVMERIIHELNGIDCVFLHDYSDEKPQQIMRSKTFGHKITQLDDLLSAITAFVVVIGDKLRSNAQLTGYIQVYARTNYHQRGAPQYMPSLGRRLVTPTNDTIALLNIAVSLVKAFYRAGFNYAKAGVVVSDLCDSYQQQGELFDSGIGRPELMAVMDKINHSTKSRVTLARQIGQQPWMPKRESLSQCYTTRWSDLPVVR